MTLNYQQFKKLFVLTWNYLGLNSLSWNTCSCLNKQLVTQVMSMQVSLEFPCIRLLYKYSSQQTTEIYSFNLLNFCSSSFSISATSSAFRFAVERKELAWTRYLCARLFSVSPLSRSPSTESWRFAMSDSTLAFFRFSSSISCKAAFFFAWDFYDLFFSLSFSKYSP